RFLAPLLLHTRPRLADVHLEVRRLGPTAVHREGHHPPERLADGELAAFERGVHLFDDRLGRTREADARDRHQTPFATAQAVTGPDVTLRGSCCSHVPPSPRLKHLTESLAAAIFDHELAVVKVGRKDVPDGRLGALRSEW